MKKYLPTITIAALWLSILPGQLFRMELPGTTAGLLVSDILVGLVAMATIGFGLSRKFIGWRDGTVRALFVWMGVVTVSSLIAATGYGTKDALIGLAYLVRLLAYLSLYVFAWQNAEKLKFPFLRYGVITTLALLFFGGLILLLMPDFASLASLGWDPHVGRMTSTWLDPNYFGSYLALVFAVATCWEKSLRDNRANWILLHVFLGLCLVGIYLTYSRSALVTLAVAGAVAALRTSRRSVFVTVISVVVLISIPSRLQTRIQSSVSYVGGETPVAAITATTSGPIATMEPADPTANARVESWRRAWLISKRAPVLGVGYNFYENAAISFGLLSASGETRGTAGSDSSALTLLATTGWVGLIAALTFFLYLGRQFYRDKSPWASAGLAALIGMAVGSQFNNLLLYPLALLSFMLLLGIANQKSTYEHH